MPTRITTDQIKDSAITEPKLAENALRPIDSGALSGTVLTFDKPQKKYSLTVSSNTLLTLASSGNIADSKIFITATGNGVNDLDFESDWRVTGEFDPNLIQKIELEYTGTHVFVTIKPIADVVVTTLTSAEVVGTTPGQVNLIFSSVVIITSPGWTLDSDGGAVNVSGVTASGTTTPTLTLDRDIEPGEVVTLSYNPTVGETTSTTGTELAAIGNFAVTVPPEVPEEPEDPNFTITVGPSGQDFTTITAANAVAVAGDIIGIKGGTYRESIVAKSGVTYQNFSGETAIVSGLELAGDTGWTVHSGNIYKKTITLPNNGVFGLSITSNISIVANQVFKDGEMQIQARYPKISSKEEMFDIYKFRHASNGTNLANATFGQGFQPGEINDTALSSLGNLSGGTVFINGWFISGTRTISTHPSPGRITFPAYANNEPINVNYRKWWMATNKLQLLTDEKEWHYESGILYFRQTGGGSPTGLEFKARNWGFDLSNKTDVVIRGLHFKGCEVRGDTNTHRCTLDGIRATYTNHVFRVEGNNERHNMEQTGFRLIGNDNTVTNSEFNFGASNCVWLGERGRAINNKMENYGYEGNYGAGVSLWGNTHNQLITRNTIDGMGRSCIDFSMTWSGSHLNVEISYNDLKGFTKINCDGGAIYTARFSTTTGLVIHHNWIHDSGAKADPQGLRMEGIMAALYMDQGTGPLLCHHNVFWNNWNVMPTVGPGGSLPGSGQGQDTADFYILARYGTHTNTPASLIYNNTFQSPVGGGAKFSYVTYLTAPHDIQKNNIYEGGIICNWGGNATTGAQPVPPNGNGTTLVSSSILSNQTPVYLNTGEGGLIYRPASGTALQVNAGVTIAGITDGHQGSNPDCGAYEWGDPNPWTAGYNAVVGGSETFVDATAANITYSTSPNWLLPQNTEPGWFGNTISYSNVAGSTATFTRSATRIKIYAERLATHGTGTVTLDGGSPVAVTFNTAPFGLQVLIWDSGVISAGSHTVVLTCTSGFVLFDYYTFV